MSLVKDKSHLMKQYELRDEAGSILVCWLPYDARVKIGVRVTLKGLPNRRWIVNTIYTLTQSISELEFRRSWKVGGIL